MDETNERIDLGVWDHDDAREGEQENPLEGQPKGDYRLYAERIVERPLNERMAHYWGGWWGPAPSNGLQRAHRMQMLIDEFGLAERSKLPDPVAVPEWVQRWLDANVSIGAISDLKAWIREAVIAGSVRVEKPDVPDEVKKAASDLPLVYGGATPPGHVGTLLKWVREQVGDSDG